MDFDVVIIGSAMAGSILSSIISRHGLKTLMIDTGRHPKFSVGESMIPGTSYLLRIMADRYGVPELDQISTFMKQRRSVTHSSGIKRNFSFVHHEKGQRFEPARSTMLPIPHYPHGPESHLMRQDIDAFLFATAVGYGSRAMQDTSVTKIEPVTGGMALETACGKRITCKYLVDASGHNSLLAKTFDLRETPTRLATHSRSIFTHMVGVIPFDDFYGPEQHGLPQPLSQGTLHHIFDGGWLWVIPFDNYEGATNRLCSVGLQLDPRKYPLDKRLPEQEFRDFLEGYPQIKQQFSRASAVRPWVSAPRLQYSSKRVVGDRFCLLAHAAGFIDPLFSRGLYITMEAINMLAHRLIEATREDDFSLERFAPLERLTQGLVDAHDKVTHGSFIAFEDFELWNAWYRVWALGGTFSSLKFRQAHLKFKRSGDKSHLDELEHHEHLGTLCADLDEYQPLFNQAYAIMLQVEAGTLAKSEAVSQLYGLYRDKDWIPPMYELANPARRFVSPGDFQSFLKSTYWGYAQAPEKIRKMYFDFPALDLFKGVARSLTAERAWMRRIAGTAKYPNFETYGGRTRAELSA